MQHYFFSSLQHTTEYFIEIKSQNENYNWHLIDACSSLRCMTVWIQPFFYISNEKWAPLYGSFENIRVQYKRTYTHTVCLHWNNNSRRWERDRAATEKEVHTRCVATVRELVCSQANTHIPPLQRHTKQNRRNIWNGNDERTMSAVGSVHSHKCTNV